MDEDLRGTLHQKVVAHLDVRNTGPAPDDERSLRTRAEAFIRSELSKNLIPEAEGIALGKAVLDEIFAYGPVTDFIADPSVSEIMVNGTDAVYVERGGKVVPTGAAFLNAETLRATIDRMIARVNRRLDEASPFVDARLPDGSRVNAIIPPVSLSGPCLTIRKFRRDPFTFEELIRAGSLTEEAGAYLREAVRSRANLVVSGGTGSGKTTLLNALSRFIPADERIVTIEDAAELRLMQPHVVRLEARPPNIEGAGAVTIRDLVRNALRMRPDRIIVGECRGGEALDMLQAMNTGHDGSITTGHANTPRDMLRRLETMVLLSGVEIPVRAIREQIASAINIIVHVSRMADGRRGIVSIAEITGMSETQIMIQELFRWTREKVAGSSGRLVGTGIQSRFHPPDGGAWE